MERSFVLVSLLFLATVFLAYTNGANDNFKGVATLVCSGVLNFRSALILTALMTFAGGLSSIYFADALVNNFSGKGFMPESFTISVEFLLAIALGAGFTVLLATLLGLPISTTHSLTGALVGTGFLAVGSQLQFLVLGQSFFLPLLLSPVIAVLLSVSIYLGYKTIRNLDGARSFSSTLVAETDSSEYSMPTDENCDQDIKNSEKSFRLSDAVHILSAAVVCFARGLHDTPKILALILFIQWLNIDAGIFIIAISMAIGGILSIKKVATTLSQKITHLEPSQGVIANLVTGFLVLFASKLGMPVSTTHVSVGSMAGIGLLAGNANISVIRTIVLSWCLTLPIAAVLSSIVYVIIA